MESSFGLILNHVGEAALFGAVQGLTEFLPISSSGHLLLLHQIVDYRALNEQAFDVALHIGTVIALLLVFWRDLWRLATATLRWLRVRGTPDTDQTLAGWLIIATIPAAIIGVLFESTIETILRSPVLASINLIVAGVFLWAIDRWATTSRDLQSLGRWRALWVGLGQALALIPGVSRSGSTIMVGRLVGLDRPMAVRFSFLLAVPITIGAALVKVPDLVTFRLPAEDWVALSTGILVAAVTGMFAIRFLLRFIAHRSFAVFAVYRALLGITALLYFWLT